eukprot:CAMPEP_0114643336 /NCGR_PEP_ID=MMETSP0191-20121206/3327_1 /TAXON_ID=126664 /ORGANISM="Sorites sp." /LENGTH=314 /DNA_ID=CAMNT_0001855619 /DNA_START=69 /DNA_END=1013 /DNA_ORIENTATION=+
MGKVYKGVSLAACFAEFVGMALFVMIGCGSAMGIQGSGSSGGSGGADDTTAGETTSMIPGWVLMVSLVFGLSITTLAYTIGHYSGGQLNCAVTLGLVLTGNCHLVQGLCNFGCQMLGSVTGAAILCAIFPPELDMTKTLGSNSVGPKWNWWNALIGEIMCTFLLVFVVHQTACNPKSVMNRSQACLAIGLAVFMAHCVMIPIDGCSINPTRSFGPALLALTRMEAPKAVEPVTAAVGEVVASASLTTKAPLVEEDAAPSFWSGMWIFWIGPLLGACLAALVNNIMIKLDAMDSAKAEERPERKLKHKSTALEAI